MGRMGGYFVARSWFGSEDPRARLLSRVGDLVIVVAVLLMSASCSDHTPVGVDEYAPLTAQARIVDAAVSPGSVVLKPGEKASFTAQFTDASGKPIRTPVLWSAGGGSINRNGSEGHYIAGNEPGDFHVVARTPSTGVTDSASVTIVAAAEQESETTGGSGNSGSDSDDEDKNDGSDDSGGEGGGGSSNAELNFYSGFETGDLSEWNQTELCCSYSAQVVTTHAREGRRSVRMELRRDERKTELRNVPWRPNYRFAGRLNGPEMWYGISIYVPDWYVPTPGDYQIVWQVHVPPGDGQKWQQPHFAAWLNANGWSYTSRSGVDGNQRQRQFNIGSVRTNGWTDFVVRAVWRNDSSGLLQIWKDGRLVVDERGPNAYGDRTREYYNTSNIYRAGSSWPASPSARHLYFDAIRIYEGSNGYSHVAPR